MAILGLFLALVLAFGFGGSSDDASDPVQGTDGDDTLSGSAGDDSLSGQGGDDLLLGLDGDDTLEGGDGNDSLDGGAGINQLNGGAGDDSLRLSDDFEDNSQYGGDVFIRDNSVLSGGAGNDLLDASGMTQSLTVFLEEDGQDLLFGGPQFNRAVQFDGIEQVRLGSAGDNVTILDSARARSVDLGAGDDLLYAMGTAAHTLQGGAGDDAITIDLNNSPASVGLVIDGGSGDETNGDLLEVNDMGAATITLDDAGTITAVVGTQTNTFQNFEAFFNRGNATDLIDATATTQGFTIDGGGGMDTILGGAGDDRLIGFDVTGGAGNDYLEGNVARGGAGDDTVYGDEAMGGAGNDTVFGQIADGGAGDDLVGGLTMIGGEGSDSFESSANFFTPTEQTNALQTITDFQPGESIDLVVRYNTLYVDQEPVVSTDSDAIANTVTVLANDLPVLVVNGTTSISPDALTIRFETYERLNT